MVLQERETAAAARLLPPQLLNMSAALLREGGRNGFVSKTEARGFFRADAQRSQRVYDMLTGMMCLLCV